MSNRLSSIESAIQALADGKIIIVMDAEDRENEGDFICAAEKVTPEIVNFMITHGRGLVCVPILPEVCERLNFPRMVRETETNAPLGTNFTVAVDHRTGRTGITAQERSTTIREIVNPESKPEDFVKPGHMYPLIAMAGGVLRRAGHTEGGVDLARMAGLEPAAVLCEILREDGDRATRDELYELARIHNLEIITIEELIRYRRQREQLVERVAEAELPTKYGMAKIVGYDVKFEDQEPIAIVIGDPASVPAPLVRLHSSCFTGDLVSSLRCDCGDQLHLAMAQMADEGAGVLVYLPHEGRGIGLVEKIKAYHLQDQGMDTVEANLALGHPADARDYGVGISVLKDLGLSQIRLLTNNDKKVDAFIYGGYDLEVVAQVPIICEVHEHNQRYMDTKRDKMGHKLD